MERGGCVRGHLKLEKIHRFSVGWLPQFIIKSLCDLRIWLLSASKCWLNILVSVSYGYNSLPPPWIPAKNIPSYGSVLAPNQGNSVDLLCCRGHWLFRRISPLWRHPGKYWDHLRDRIFQKSNGIFTPIFLDFQPKITFHNSLSQCINSHKAYNWCNKHKNASYLDKLLTIYTFIGLL